MDAGQIRLAQDIFNEVVDLDQAGRETVVAQRCGGDTVLLEYVRNLLKSHDGGMGDFLETAPPSADLSEQLQTPEVIGPYHIIEQIGEGGMGIVYLAEQQTPVRRRVAVKVITPGMDTKRVLARFDAERQVLAMMNHSCIAKIFDAGATPEGRPYFVMEFIEGVPITTYCDNRRLRIEERLRLFARVCDAVQHAHQRGVIHRDLKPTNVLIAEEDGQPQPKIIDFGVAKASSTHVSGQATMTISGQLIGTLEYMSPEQVEDTSGDLDVRSDVYSLGVMLYELLTGMRPIDSAEMNDRPLSEVIHNIRHTHPVTPSARLSTADAPRATRLLEARGTTLLLARRRLRGDLDWITMKAIEKDRDRRYQSALELAADVERHLTGDMVQAAPPSFTYRARKLIQRNKARSAFVSLAAVAIIAGGAFAFVLALTRAREAESRLAAMRYEEARTLDWHVDDAYLTSFPNAWGTSSGEVIARVAGRVYAGEASDEEMRRFAGAMMRYRFMGSTLQVATSPRVTLVMGGKRDAIDWPGILCARVTPRFEINGEALELSSRETSTVLLDLGTPEQLTVNLGSLPAARERLRSPGSYTIRGDMTVQLVRIESGTMSALPLTGEDASRYDDVVGPPMAFPISPFDFTVVEHLPFTPAPTPGASLAGASPIDLSHWRAEHYRPDVTPGIWVRSPDGRSVEQVQHGGVSLFVSNEDFRASRVAARVQVLTGSDDDYIGMVFGYQGRDSGYYVFYWKQFGQPTTSGSMAIYQQRLGEGMHLIRVPEHATDMEVLRSSETQRVSVLASHAGRGTGWQDFQPYLIDVDYDPAGTIRLTVSEIPSGRLLWDSGAIVDPDPLGAGKIGFFNHSQTNVLYSAYYLPDDAPLAASH